MSPPEPPPAVAQFDARFEFEALLADLSSRFVHVASGELDGEIEDALRRVCESLGLDLAVVWQWSSTAPGVIRPTHAYFGLEGAKPSEPMRQEQYPWCVEQMLAGRGFAMSSPDVLPAEAAVDRETCRLYGIKSAVCLPLSVGDDVEPIYGIRLNFKFSTRSGILHLLDGEIDD